MFQTTGKTCFGAKSFGEYGILHLRCTHTHTTHMSICLHTSTQARIGCISADVRRYIYVDRPAQFTDVLNGLIMHLLSCVHLPENDSACIVCAERNRQ